MNDATLATQPRKWWVRALLMLLMGAAFHLAAMVLIFIAVVQLVLFVAAGEANERLRAWGAALGRYLAQIAGFVCFTTEEAPFPFRDWPA